MGKHPAFHRGPKAAHNYLATEFQTARSFGLDPDVYFAKPRLLRALMTSTFIGDNSVQAMRDYDMMKEREKK